MIKKILSRLPVYLAELAHCLRIGVTLRDKLLLLHETVWFHLHHHRPGLVLEARVKIGELRPLLRMRRYGGDIFIFHEVLRCGVYEFPESLLCEEPQVIMDLGANIGLATLSIISRFPGARVVCVEPHPENAQLLRHNLRCLGDRATVIESAASNHSGYIDLAVSAEHYNASLVRDSSEVVRVKALTVEEVMSEAGIATIDVLKMDIEGAELALLEARPHWLEKVRLILAELHGPRQDEMISWISEAGFKMKRDGCQIIAWRPKNRFARLWMMYAVLTCGLAVWNHQRVWCFGSNDPVLVVEAGKVVDHVPLGSAPAMTNAVRFLDVYAHRASIAIGDYAGAASRTFCWWIIPDSGHALALMPFAAPEGWQEIIRQPHSVLFRKP